MSCCGIVYCVFLLLFLLKSLWRMCFTAGLFTVYFYSSFSCRACGECVLLRDCSLCISTTISLVEPGEVCVLLWDCLLCISSLIYRVESGKLVHCCAIADLTVCFYNSFSCRAWGSLCLAVGLFTVYFYSSFS